MGSAIGWPAGGPLVPIPKPMRILMAIVIGVSVPEGLALLFGPREWNDAIWGWQLTPLSSKFIAGIYMAVSLGFVMAWREEEWERTRIALAMLWSFSLVALVSAFVAVVTSPGVVVVHFERPFTWVWIVLYVVSVAGGLYYHLIYPRTVGARAF